MQNPKFWQTAKFKSLEKKWYEKLRVSGFSDAERLRHGNLELKQTATRCMHRHNTTSEIERENKFKYYDFLSIKTNEETFLDSVERLVMERTADGLKIKEICEELKKLNERCHRHTVGQIIRKYELKWGLRKKK